MNSLPLISANYPGGNILVVREAPGRLWLAPDCRHMIPGQSWFYWSFQANNRQPLTVTFSHRNYISARGPAISRNGGCSWSWLGLAGVTKQPLDEHHAEWSFEIPAVAEHEDIRYAFCPQYQQSDLERWYAQHASHPALSVAALCTSRKGRHVEVIRIQNPTTTDRPIIWLTARHHACETIGNYVMEGILDAALADDELGHSLRSHWQIVAIPFVDKDGVEEGDQGKMRAPHDHNRDYNETPLYPEVTAIMQFGQQHRANIVSFIDLHCPMVHGLWDSHIYLVGSSIPEVSTRQDAFAEVLQHTMTGLIPLYTTPVLHYGKAWNQRTNFSTGSNACLWAGSLLSEAALVSSLEIPYALSSGVEVNPDSARCFGRDLARALNHYLLQHGR